MQTEHLAIASIPVQQWSSKLYEHEQALKVGTIFPELNKPFFAADGPDMQGNSKMAPEASGAAAKSTRNMAAAPGQPQAMSLDGSAAKAQQQERETLMSQISAISFALDDVVLFIDTHPKSQEAATVRTRLIEERKRLLKDFDEKFYPLTKDCEGAWGEGPMPWEGACI